MDLLKELESLVPELERGLDQASSLTELEELRVAFLGRKGRLAQIMGRLPELSPEDRPRLGQAANGVKMALTERFEGRKATLEAASEAAALSRFDPTLPGRAPWRGSLHPDTLVMEEICSVFRGLGYDIVTGPEVEMDHYNFEALNMPAEHPARDMQDTLYVTESILMRTHTSPLQVRTMLARKPPVAIIAPGKVYRRDSDITHTPMFHQIEGLMVDKGVSMADLRGTLTSFLRTVFGGDTRVRFRPSFFPFTEPSAEVATNPAGCARPPAGSKSWAAAWWTPPCSPPWAMIQKSTPASPSASAWNAWPCSSTVSATCACFSRMMCGFCRSLRSHWPRMGLSPAGGVGRALCPGCARVTYGKSTLASAKACPPCQRTKSLIRGCCCHDHRFSNASAG